MSQTTEGDRGAAPGRAVVVGASGLVGSAVTARLVACGWQVTSTVRDVAAAEWAADALSGADVVFVPDLLEQGVFTSVLERTRPAVVICCAGVMTADGPDALPILVEGNVASVATVLASSSATGAGRLILFGSGFEYAPSDRPADEASEIGPTTIYGATKAAASTLAIQCRAILGLDVCVIRPFSLHGPRERPHRFVPTVVTQALTGRAIEMSIGTQVRDYLFVEDLADGIERAARFDGILPPALNFSGPQAHTLIDVARLVIEITGSAAELRPGSRPANPADRATFLGDSGLATRTLGWQPGPDLRTGLARTIDWYARNRSRWAA